MNGLGEIGDGSGLSIVIVDFVISETNSTD